MTTDNKSMTQAEKLEQLVRTAWGHTEIGDTYHLDGSMLKILEVIDRSTSGETICDIKLEHKACERLELNNLSTLKDLIRGLILAKGWMPEGWVAKLYYLGNILQQITGTEIDEPRGTSHTLTLEQYYLCRAILAGEGAIDYLYGVFIDA